MCKKQIPNHSVFSIGTVFVRVCSSAPRGLKHGETRRAEVSGDRSACNNVSKKRMMSIGGLQ